MAFSGVNFTFFTGQCKQLSTTPDEVAEKGIRHKIPVATQIHVTT
jgi:hypothetical protein